MSETPISLEAEQIVLSGLCIGIYDQNYINSNDFYNDKHKTLFNVIKRLLEDVSIIDSSILYSEIERLKLNSQVGREDYVIDTVEGKQIQAKYNAEYWFKVFKETSQKRKSLYFVNQMSDNIESKGISVNEIFKKLTDHILSLESNTNLNNTLNIKNLCTFMGNKKPEFNWLVEGLIVEGSVILLVAKPKIGKSILALNIALAISRGETLLGRKTKKGRTLYIALEDREKLVQSRLWTILNRPESFGIDISCDTLFLDDSNVRNELTLTITENKYELVVIDPLIESYRNADESSANDMVKVMAWIREIAQETGCSFLVVHHSRKSEGEGGDVIRGSSAIWGAVDGSIFLKPLETSQKGKKVSIEAILRDAESGEKAVISLNDSLMWQVEGNFEEFKIKSTIEKILEYLKDGEATISEISKGIDLNYDTVKKALYRLCNDKKTDSRALGNNRNAGKKYFLSHEISQEHVPRKNAIDIEELPVLFDSLGKL